jgi:hypothetical protein
MADFVGHKKINRFGFSGSINDESDIPRMKEQYVSLLQDYMKSKGYLRNLDLDPVFTIEYNGKHFNFIISVYGSYVGRAKAKCYQGIVGTRLIPMSSTARIKSDQSSIHAKW